MENPNIFLDFKKLSDSILLYQPSVEQTARAKYSPDPSLIVLCTWVAAQPKPITRYINKYRRYFPNASILIIQTTLYHMVFLTDNGHQNRLKIVIDIICNQNGTVHLHGFSNGGAVTVSQLLFALPSSYRQNTFSALVLDSCPGRGTYGRTAKAMIVSLPKNPIARLLGAVPVHAVLVVLYVLDKLGFGNVISRSRWRLNEEALFELKVPRLYIYSRADEMVCWSDVHDHADEARRKGYERLTELVFDGSGHCAHIREDEDKYWKAVKECYRLSPSLRLKL
jgi:hypothetical protein